MSPRKRQYRKRKACDEDGQRKDDGQRSLSEQLEGTRLLQNQRKTKVGLDVETLSHGEGPKNIETVEGGGGQPDEGARADTLQSYVKARAMRVTGENEHMNRYVEEAMAKRLGRAQQRNSDSREEDKELQEKKEAELYEIPDNLKSHGTPNVIIPGLMTGITEVQLPMDVRLKNIEETEAAKKQLLETSAFQKPIPRCDDDEDLPQTFKDTFEVKRSMFVPTFGRTTRRPEGGPSDELVAARFIEREKQRRMAWKRR